MLNDNSGNPQPVQLGLEGVEPKPVRQKKPPKQPAVKAYPNNPVLPVIPQSDKIIKALSRLPLPPYEMVQQALSKRGDQGTICRIWALLLAADAHAQIKTGTRFEGPTNEEAGRYAPGIPGFFPSRSAAGGALKLTQDGFNRIQVPMAKLGGGVTSVHLEPNELLANEGQKHVGYRFVQGGEAVLRELARLAGKLNHEGLRLLYRRYVQEIQTNAREVAKRRAPAHHVLRLSFGYGRKGRVLENGQVENGATYLNVKFGSDYRDEFLELLFGKDVPEKPSVRGLMHPDGTLELRGDADGYAVSSTCVQIASASRGNISETARDYGNLIELLNFPVIRVDGEGGRAIRVKLSPKLYADRGGDGTRLRDSKGSAPGRVRSQSDVTHNVTEFDAETKKTRERHKKLRGKKKGKES